MLYLELIAQGLVQGSIYAAIALGLTLVYGLLRILHVAHAALFTLGAYVGVIVTNATGSLVLGFLAAMLVSGLVGVAVFRIGYKPMLGRPPFIPTDRFDRPLHRCRGDLPDSFRSIRTFLQRSPSSDTDSCVPRHSVQAG
jgi:hypothetical protein